MRYKKYLLFIMLIMLFLPVNIVGAIKFDMETYSSVNCYYVGDETGFSGYITFRLIGLNGSSGVSGELTSMLINGKGDYTTFPVKNINGSWDYSGRGEVSARLVDINAIKSNYNNCPKYVFGTYGGTTLITGGNWDNVSGITDDKNAAISGYNNISSISGKKSCFWGKLVTENEYWGGLGLCNNGSCELGENVVLTCDNHELFGDPNQAGEEIDLNGNGKLDPPSLAYTINQVLKYMRIIVPMMIILLGTIDIAKAVIASKEDEIKQAQKKFVKRVVAGVAVFLVPVFVNIIMNLADIVWKSSNPNESYTSCTLEQIQK